jgi:hypothetical protein
MIGRSRNRQTGTRPILPSDTHGDRCRRGADHDETEASRKIDEIADCLVGYSIRTRQSATWVLSQQLASGPAYQT